MIGNRDFQRIRRKIGYLWVTGIEVHSPQGLLRICIEVCISLHRYVHSVRKRKQHTTLAGNARLQGPAR